jgi:DNA invertase Pin-like site-specific DNA recombinase
MMKAANQRKFDMIMVWSIDRLGRSLQNLVEILNDLQSMRVDLMFLQQGTDTNTPSARMMFWHSPNLFGHDIRQDIAFDAITAFVQNF